MNEHIAKSFTSIYKNSAGESDESRSGAGSELENTRVLRQRLPLLLSELGIGTILDAGCGDFNWMKCVHLPCRYIGVDVVSTIIAENKRSFQSKCREFECVDITEDRLPEADLVLCRLCFQHLSNQLVMKAIENFRSTRAAWLLATTFSWPENRDIAPGGFRYINLCASPFNFPEPIKTIYENPAPHCSVALGLWPLSSIPSSSLI